MTLYEYYAFDAEQLSFKKLDDDNITWVTIKGNHVPIPKGGTREQKAEAIKKWFASKKKELPQAKGRLSFYSAKVEHDVPKASARGTGEQAQVHGEGQYSLKYAKNNYENYFKKFSLTKTLATSLTTEEKRGLHGWASSLFGGMNTVESVPKIIDKKISQWKESVAKMESEKENYSKIFKLSREETEKLLDNPEEMKKLGIPERFTDVDEVWRWAGQNSGALRENIRQNITNIQNAMEAKQKLEKYREEGRFWEESAIYKVGEKLYSKDVGKAKMTQRGMRYWQVNKLYNMSLEERQKERENNIENAKKQIADYEQALKDMKKGDWDYNWQKLQYEKDIKLLQKEQKWWEDLDVADINPAKAQMSKVELPATKTYLREATGLRNQSTFVKNGIKKTLVSAYNINTLREEYGLNDIADEFEYIIDDALGLNKANSSGEHIKVLLENMSDKMSTGLEHNLMRGHTMGQEPKEYLATATPFGKREENVRLNNAKYLVDKIASDLRVTLLATVDDGKKLVINSGRGLYNKLGAIVANAKTKSYWGASIRQRQADAKKLLLKNGINGIAYKGHGVSAVSGWSDGEGNVTFDPSRMKVLEKTTDPAVIEKWIKEQEQHGQKAVKK